jgi:hypothetical protein
MMKVTIAGDDIIENYLYLDKVEFRSRFLYCLPQDENGNYHVSSDNAHFVEVQGAALWDYPFVKINTCYEGYWEGVNDKGVALLAFELASDKNDVDLNIYGYPSFISTYDNKVQFIFRLKRFITNGASEHFYRYHDAVSDKISTHLNAIQTDVIINPLSNSVDSYLFNIDGDDLKGIYDVAKYVATKEHIREVRAKGGKIAAQIRKNKTIDAINAAIKALQAEGKTINQTIVAKVSGVHRVTVNKYWAEISIDSK